jgi:magnesium-transporting ATPase (P-type)
MSGNPLHAPLIKEEHGHGHGGGGHHGAPKASTVPLEERLGLTSEQAAQLTEKWGYNELPQVIVPLWYIFFIQFTGTMPYMLELACILALIVEDWIDFAIIFTMVCCNGYLGFHEELKAKESLVRSSISSCATEIFMSFCIDVDYVGGID